MVSEGHFVLRPRIAPDLPAGDWRIRADHDVAGTGNSVGPVAESNVHFTINSPRFMLPPGEILSTFPPANSIGSYGTRLPQVVLKRRTLPWERTVDEDQPQTPYMALVLIAEGEAEFRTGVPAAECFSDGTDLPFGDTLDDAEVASGNCLAVRESVVRRIFPTQQEVDILAHSREVDINDTELALGDDDGYLSVVVSNRLPVAGVGEDGQDTPVTYLACLVNLEGQFDKLLPESPDPVFITPLMFVSPAIVATSTTSDHAVMNTAQPSVRVTGDLLGFEIEPGQTVGPLTSSFGGSVARPVQVTAAARNANVAFRGGTAWSTTDPADSQAASAQIYADMAANFSVAGTTNSTFSATAQIADEELRFPVMLHWSFTTSGNTTFETLMRGLDSRMLGDAADDQPTPNGRPPLEVVETGHAGLVHRTRDGDEVRSWYRGPLSPHPMDNARARRLPLAHSSDQLRTVTPDRREDLSLAAGFEVGRLLALSQPSIIAALLRWRQDDFRAARLGAVLEAAGNVFDELGILDILRDGDILRGDPWGVLLGRGLVRDLVQAPDGFLGQPRPLLTPGRPLEFDGVPSDVLATGLGIEPGFLRGRPDVVFERLRGVDTAVADLNLDKIESAELLGGLQAPIDNAIRDLSTDVLADGLVFEASTGAAFGPVGIPELIDVDAADHFTAVLEGNFSVANAVDAGTISGVLDEASVIDGLGETTSGARTIGRLRRGGVPLASSPPTNDIDEPGES